jgi:amino acid transporter
MISLTPDEKPIVATIHPRFKAPYIAIPVHAVVLIALANCREFDWLAYQSVAATLLLYLLSCLAAWELSRRDQRLEGSTSPAVRGEKIIPWLGCAAILWTFTHLERTAMVGVGAIVTGASGSGSAELVHRQKDETEDN